MTTTQSSAAPAAGRAALPQPSRHVPRGTVRPSRRSRWRAASLVAVHVLVLIHLAHWKVAGSTLTPVEPSESMQTLELGYVNAGFVLFAVAILATLIFGRFFCGWLCHVVAYQDLCAWLLAKVGLKPRPVRSRLLVWVPLGAAFYMFVWPRLSGYFLGERFPALQAHFTTDQFWATFPGPGIAALTILVDGFLIVWLLGAKGFCTYGCPYGAFFGLADRSSRGRIRVTDACEGCGHCTATCTSNVRVHEEVARFKMVVDPGCMKCMDCVSVCPKDALYFGFGSSRGSAVKDKRPRKVYDFTWGEELAMAVVFLGSLYALRLVYDLVPFLLAIGLSVFAALTVVVLWRLVRDRSFTLQRAVLRAEGRWTAAGVATLLFGALFLAFVTHSGYVNYNAREGERLLIEAGKRPRAEQSQLLTASLDHLLRAERSGLVQNGKLDNRIGAILRAQGDAAGAEERFRRAIELEPAMKAPRLALADLMIVRRDLHGAERVLVELLALDPDNPDGQKRLAAVRAALAAESPEAR